jgi:RNA polymerase sigma-70 factor, ECF subfamily
VDEQLIERARQGDRSARDLLLRELQDPWYRFCHSLLGDADLARDATQETALRFLSKLSSFEAQSTLLTWSMGIAVNVAREMRRRRLRGGISEHVADDLDDKNAASPGAAADLAELRTSVQAVLHELPQRQREAVVLRFFQELSVDETAVAMDCAAGTVKATIHQALRKLRTRLSQLA